MVESGLVDWLIRRLVDKEKMEFIPFLPPSSNLQQPLPIFTIEL
jgi:hypothetical protein